MLEIRGYSLNIYTLNNEDVKLRIRNLSSIELREMVMVTVVTDKSTHVHRQVIKVHMQKKNKISYSKNRYFNLKYAI